MIFRRWGFVDNAALSVCLAAPNLPEKAVTAMYSGGVRRPHHVNRKQREKGEARVNQAFSIEGSGSSDSLGV